MNCEIQRKIYLDGAFLVLAFAVPCFAAIGLMTLKNAGTDELLAVRMAVSYTHLKLPTTSRV